ncbi:hypothetical protein [Sphingomonas sp. ID0503]|uniref:hypothetical protein n=1 Tax=Sphingomonas sp. ID0503 TaxID=3399691 RepID=UPI003AFB63B8
MADTPSTRFPFINLTKALDRAEALYNDDRRGNGLKMPTAFASWGYSDKSSGGFQTVAALKGYGLLADAGANAERAVKLTDAARKYFMTEIEDDRAELRATFALSPNLMRHLHKHWGDELPSDPVARSYLKTEIGLNDQSARAALGIYKDNLTFVFNKGSGDGDDDQATAPTGGDRQEDVTVQHSQVQATAPQRTAPTMIVEGPELKLSRSVNGGYVIHLSGAIMNKAHAEEALTLITALKAALREAPEMPSPTDDGRNI